MMSAYPAFFEVCFTRLVGNEGALSMDPKDRGNWDTGVVGKGTLKGTKYGISAMTYPDLDIKNLTLDQAKAIYFRDWWVKAGAEYLPNDTLYALWEFAVNAGMGSAKRVLQRAVGVAVDGDIGPASQAAIKKMDPKDLMLMFTSYKIEYYTSLKADNWAVNGRGWMNRVAANLRYAAQDN